MFVEFLSHVLAFDLVWIFNLVLNNLVLAFGLFALAYYFSTSQKLKEIFVFFLLVVFTAYVTIDFAKALGWFVYVPAFFMFDYILPYRDAGLP